MLLPGQEPVTGEHRIERDGDEGAIGGPARYAHPAVL